MAMYWFLLSGLVKMNKLSLHAPAICLKDAFLNGFKQLTEKSDQLAWIYLGDDADKNTPTNDFNNYVKTLLKRQKQSLPGFVPGTIWWAIHENEMVGRIAIRHELNAFLREVGGHIGYIVHPLWRNRGIATWMLKEVLKTRQAKSIGKILITCDESNLASEKTITRNGGVYEKTVELGSGQTAKKHFWIEVGDTDG